MDSKPILDILREINSLAAYQTVRRNIRAGKNQTGLAIPRAVRLPVLAALHADLDRPLLFIVDRADHAAALYDELAFWAPSVPRFLFSEPNPLFYEESSWSNATRRDRLQVLTTLATYHMPGARENNTHPLIVSSARALMTRTLPRRDFLVSTKRVSINKTYQPDSLLRSFIAMGYEVSDTVLEPGMVSRRGGLIDLWPLAGSHPLRLEFFGDQLDTMRCFDPGTQRTIEKIGSVLITPAREFISPKNGLPDNLTQLTEFHIPILYPLSANVLEYLPQDSLVVVDDLGLFESAVIDSEKQAVKLRSESISEGTLADNFPLPYFTLTELNEYFQLRPYMELGYSTTSDGCGDQKRLDSLSTQFSPIERFGGKVKQFIEFLVKKNDEGASVVVISRQSGRLEELWTEHVKDDIPASIYFIEHSLSAGWSFSNWCIISDSEIFGWERPQPRMRSNLSAKPPEMAYADLEPGEWIVHIDYGIGRFAGLVKRSLDGLEREFLCVEFQNSDQVFVPIYQVDRLTRYLGPGGAPPVAGHLGTQEWSETKRKVREAVQEVAQDLLDLYALRQLSTGYSFSPDTAWQGELESSFPYIETPDQKKALADIKRDMEAVRPMDRLLCGDVGYGKTEVALRAAFKAIMDGKQVAVLVPTTVLAQQHYETFKQRLSAFPVTVEMLSRFRTSREQAQILIALAQGAVDIVIGTHRLISSDVRFKDLGLVIIDEEQRFGVSHKERLKRLRTEVDVLTLTATPIPRTLYMALTGVRDISNLNTPPDERLPIVTHIGPYSPKLVRQAILRELERGGQVFFVHNRIQTIHAMKMHLEKLVPNARIAIAHGQMPEQELASVMRQFNAGNVDVLLSTSIIESGLDIPNANTLIVDRGDAFGLAQLYQLRGRVGRGATRAYAYFFRHRKLIPTPEGQERLEVIAENTQLGAGYSIAMRDLEMRGAGEILGTRQSGHIASVGFHLYTRLLAVAVRNLRLTSGLSNSDQGEMLTIPDINLPVNVDLPLAVGIPETYVPDQSLRLRLYRRLADLTDESALEALSEEFEDRFGSLPVLIKNLFFQMQVKIRAEKVGLISVGMESGQIVLRYLPSTNDEATKHLPDLGQGIRGGKNAYWCKFGTDADWQHKLLDVLEILAKRKEEER
jgi:transcription-repair coupling factor (superfamily II helicase)